MYDNKVHSVEHRIVSISQQWLCPIVRGKTKAPVEFLPQFDLSLDNEGYGRIEKIPFEAYNERGCLIKAAERFRERTGYYPERILADQIYRTRDNRNYCKDHGIRLSGPKLGRPGANAKADKSCITTKLEETQLTSIALSVFVMNQFKIQKQILCALLHLFRFWNRYKHWNLQISA